VTEEQAQLPLIEALGRAKPEDRAQLCRFLSDSGVDAVCTYLDNAGYSPLKGRKRVKRKLKDAFAAHPKDLGILIKSKGASTARKKKALERQSGPGGSLSALIKHSLPLIKKLLAPEEKKKEKNAPSEKEG